MDSEEEIYENALSELWLRTFTEKNKSKKNTHTHANEKNKNTL